MMPSNPLKVCEKLFFDAPQSPFTRSFGSWRKSLLAPSTPTSFGAATRLRGLFANLPGDETPSAV